MTTKTKRRILKAGITLLVMVGLIFAYRSYAAASRVAEFEKLANEMRTLPPEQRKGASEKMRNAMSKLTRDERREVFERGEQNRLKEFFKLSEKEKNAYLDNLIKRELEWRKNRQAAAKKANTSKGATKTANNGNNGGRGGPGGGQGGGNNGQGGGRQNMSPEQRAQARRQQLDQTSPESRGMRAAFRTAMQQRRQQLGLPAGGGRGR